MTHRYRYASENGEKSRMRQHVEKQSRRAESEE